MARLQELGRQGVQVMAINSPTWADEGALEGWAERRLAFYPIKEGTVECSSSLQNSEVVPHLFRKEKD
jgi:hypothetical protein